MTSWTRLIQYLSIPQYPVSLDQLRLVKMLLINATIICAINLMCIYYKTCMLYAAMEAF